MIRKDKRTASEIKAELYGVWLTAVYADGFNGDMIHDINLELKELKKSKRKSKFLLGKIADRYKELTGETPKMVKYRGIENGS